MLLELHGIKEVKVAALAEVGSALEFVRSYRSYTAEYAKFMLFML